MLRDKGRVQADRPRSEFPAFPRAGGAVEAGVEFPTPTRKAASPLPCEPSSLPALQSWRGSTA